MDMSGLQRGATYVQIKAYAKEQKCRIIERENYNKAKYYGVKQPKCTPDKERANYTLRAFLSLLFFTGSVQNNNVIIF